MVSQMFLCLPSVKVTKRQLHAQKRIAKYKKDGRIKPRTGETAAYLMRCAAHSYLAEHLDRYMEYSTPNVQLAMCRNPQSAVDQFTPSGKQVFLFSVRPRFFFGPFVV